MLDILSLEKEELEDFVSSLGEPRFRAAQIFSWLHRGVTSFDEMTDLSKRLRQSLSEQAYIVAPSVERKLVSRLDGTVKYLFAMDDGELIESVFMRYHHGNTVCISTQAGCRMGCRFCASTIGGLSRNLLPSEMLGQVLAIIRDTGENVSGVVMMGTGEPLDNFQNSVKFIKLISAPGGLNIGCRHISLSTCGIVDGIYSLAEEELPITLSISLHASDDEKRGSIMPVNNKWGIDPLLCACRDYFDKTGRRISFEYTLISGENDGEADRLSLVRLLKKYMGKRPFHVNLIPVNTVEERDYRRDEKRAAEFAAELEKSGVNATVRRRLGSDINASCGQLRASAKTTPEEKV